MKRLFEIKYKKSYDSSNPIIKHIKASSRLEAITLGMPCNEIGEEENIESIEVNLLCNVDEIIECTSAQGR